MTIVDLNIKKIYEPHNMVEFFEELNLIEEAKKLYEIKDIEDVYTLGLCDQDEIEEWLEKSERLFDIEYFDDNICGYFRITEYNK